MFEQLCSKGLKVDDVSMAVLIQPMVANVRASGWEENLKAPKTHGTTLNTDVSLCGEGAAIFVWYEDKKWDK